MDAKTEKALKKSIAHWYRISATTTVMDMLNEGVSSEDCALCEAFFACIDCPVAVEVGTGGCHRTPYYPALRSLNHWRDTGDWYNTDQGNIEAEIRFLESLLP